MFTQRSAIREEINANREMINELRERNKYLIDLLGHLDETEKVIDPDAVIMNLIDVIKELKTLIPNVPAETLIAQVAKSMQGYNNNIYNEEKNITYNVSNTVNVESTPRKKKYTDLKKLAKIALAYLKEVNEPLEMDRIFQYLEEEHGQRWNKATQYSTMKNLMNYEPSIERLEGSKAIYKARI